jgi:hypothetical protein
MHKNARTSMRNKYSEVVLQMTWNATQRIAEKGSPYFRLVPIATKAIA